MAEELAGFASFCEGNGGETTGFVKVVVDVKGIEGRIQGTKARSSPQAAFDLGHEGKEEGSLAHIEGLRVFSQDDVTGPGQLGDDNTTGVSPVENCRQKCHWLVALR